MTTVLNNLVITIERSGAKLKYTVNGVEVTGDVYATGGNHLVWACRERFDLEITNFTGKPSGRPVTPPKRHVGGSPFDWSSKTSSPGTGGMEEIPGTVHGGNHGSYKYKVTLQNGGVEDDPLIIVD